MPMALADTTDHTGIREITHMGLLLCSAMAKFVSIIFESGWWGRWSDVVSWLVLTWPTEDSGNMWRREQNKECGEDLHESAENPLCTWRRFHLEGKYLLPFHPLSVAHIIEQRQANKLQKHLRPLEKLRLKDEPFFSSVLVTDPVTSNTLIHTGFPLDWASDYRRYLV